MTVPGFFELLYVWDIIAPLLGLLGLTLIVASPLFLRGFLIYNYPTPRIHRAVFLFISWLMLFAIVCVLIGAAWMWSGQ